MNFRRSPTSMEILTVIATCTEVPRMISKHIIGSSRTIEDNFRFLVNEKYISKMKPSKGVASYRLTKKGRFVLCDPQVNGKSRIFEEYFERFAPELCGNQKQIYRLHKQSEVIVACHNAKINSYVGEKPFLSGFLPLREMGVSPCFFNSQELKKSFASQDKFASASRVIGSIVTPDNIFFVYNSGKYPINFSVDQERKAYQTFCETIIKKGFVPLSIVPSIVKALINSREALYSEALLHSEAIFSREATKTGTITAANVSSGSRSPSPRSSTPHSANFSQVNKVPPPQANKPLQVKTSMQVNTSGNPLSSGNPNTLGTPTREANISGNPNRNPLDFIKAYCMENILNMNGNSRSDDDRKYIECVEKLIERHVINYCNENKDAIIIGDDWSAAREMLELSDSYIAKTLIQPRNSVYNTMRYIPNTREGEETLRIITSHAWKERILSMVVPPEDIAEGIPYETGCDLFTRDRLACYCMIDMNLTRLIDMKRWLMSRDEERINYEIKIICFSYQAEILKEWFGRLIDEDSYVEITIEDADNIMRETKEEYGEWEEAIDEVKREVKCLLKQ